MLLKKLHLGNAQETVDIRVPTENLHRSPPTWSPSPGRRR